MLKYFCITDSLASCVPSIWLDTSCESVTIFMFLAPVAMHRLMPARAASYSASLLEALKPKRTAYSKVSPFSRRHHYTHPDPRLGSRAIHRYLPGTGRLSGLFTGRFDYEVGQGLGLDSCAWLVFDVKFEQFNCPF